MASLECDFVKVSTDERGVATVLLQRTENHNAFNAEMIKNITDAFMLCVEDDAVRVVVLKSSAKHFSAGADLNWMKDSVNFSEAENIDDAKRLAGMCEAIATCPKPTMVVVDGACYGGAVGIVACCDIAVAGPRAKFCLSEVKLGLIPAVISPYVTKAIGVRQAGRFMLTAEVIDTKTALAIGLVHEQATEESKEERLEMFISQCLQNGPRALAEVKTLLQDVANSPIDSTLTTKLAKCIARIRTSEEAQAGLSAFLEKRKPDWSK